MADNLATFKCCADCYEIWGLNAQGLSRAIQGCFLKEDIYTWFQHIL
jgi:hypothetical protein